MKTKSLVIGLIAGFVVFSAVLVLFTCTTVAQEEEDPIRFNGTITDANGNPYSGLDIEIKKENGPMGTNWISVGTATTDANGYYETVYGSRDYYPLALGDDKLDNYRMYINGNLVDERYLDGDDWVFDGTSIEEIKGHYVTVWKYSYQWTYQIPEFATIAIPVAAVLGLLFFFNHSKRRNE